MWYKIRVHLLVAAIRNAMLFTLLPDKANTAMVIRPLDDRTRYDQSVVADLQLEVLGVGDGRIR